MLLITALKWCLDKVTSAWEASFHPINMHQMLPLPYITPIEMFCFEVDYTSDKLISTIS